MSKSQRQYDDYLDDLQEWNNHQYDPFYFTGSRMPYFMKRPTKELTRLYFAEGLIIVCFFAILFLAASDSQEVVSMTFSGNSVWDMAAVTLAFGSGILLMLAGIRGRKRLPHKKLPPVKFRK